MKKKSFAEYFKQNVKKTLEIASELSDILIHIRAKPTPLAYASIGLRAYNAYLRQRGPKVMNSNPFASLTGEEKWLMYDLGSINDYLCELILNNFPFEKVSGSESHYYVVSNVDNVEIGIYCEKSAKDGIWYRDGTLPKVLEKLNNLIWNSLNSKFISFGCKPSTKYNGKMEFGEMEFSLQADTYDNIYPSKVAEKIFERISSFLSHELNRSFMLLGEPGTGKSAALSYISKKLNLKTLRISVSDMSSISAFDMSILVSLLKPEVLIVDDFDRIDMPDHFLTELEQISQNIKVFLVSVNDTSMLSQAMLRPGRIDDIIDFVTLESEIHDKLIGDEVPDEIKDRLKKLPIAYIADFEKRKKVLGVETAIIEVEQLEKRIKELDVE